LGPLANQNNKKNQNQKKITTNHTIFDISYGIAGFNMENTVEDMNLI
jgi:hypothetical protein